jgi:hypothetical protein
MIETTQPFIVARRVALSEKNGCAERKRFGAPEAAGRHRGFNVTVEATVR